MLRRSSTAFDAHPDAPIVLVEDRNYTNGYFIPAKARRNRESQQALQAQYQALLADGVKHLYYIRGADLLGDDGEATVDSSHPTDLGFMRQARAFEKVLRPILP